jgi:lipoprotein Spr
MTLLLVAGVSASGCGAAKPRFIGESRPAQATGVFASTVADREESGESVATARRDFRHERNVPLTPLEQSRLMREISKYMGVPYELGGASGTGFDCSGYTLTVYRDALNRQLPRSSAEQFTLGRPVSYDDLRFGDLLFFNTTGESASHVGIYLGDDLFAHAAVMLGVSVSSLESSYYRQRYEGARRLIGE